MRYLILGCVLFLIWLSACGGGSVGTGPGLPPVKLLVGEMPETDDELDLLNEIIEFTTPVSVNINILGECSKLYDRVSPRLVIRNTEKLTDNGAPCEVMLSALINNEPVARASYSAHVSTCDKPDTWKHYAEGVTSRSGIATLQLPTDNPRLCHLRIRLVGLQRTEAAKIELKSSSN